jgi:diguanylate cyclase (GGDEF)-like protein
VASAGTTAIRAAVSVAIAAGNTRVWSEASSGVVTDVPLAAFPEVIRAAIEPAGVRTAQIALVGEPDAPACYTMWLSPLTSISAEADALHRAALAQLADAVMRDHKIAMTQHARRSTDARPEPVDVAPDAPAIETMFDSNQFDAQLVDVHSDQIGLIAITIDGLDELGAELSTLVERTVADRLASSLRAHDVIAHVGDGSFALLLLDVDRRTAFEISKRVRSRACQPVEAEHDLLAISLSVGLAHESGLVDPVELFASAQAALSDARQAGGARMLVAS